MDVRNGGLFPTDTYRNFNKGNPGAPSSLTSGSLHFVTNGNISCFFFAVCVLPSLYFKDNTQLINDVRTAQSPFGTHQRKAFRLLRHMDSAGPFILNRRSTCVYPDPT
jgi:hypothetical protein